MEGISDICIVGIDERRPPRMRKEPYIDLYFKFSHQVPPLWGKGFNDLMAKHPYAPKVPLPDGMYIETWVRNPDEIAPLLDQLKRAVAECTREYIESIERSVRVASAAAAAVTEESGEQGRLNRIIAGLDFTPAP